VIHAALLTVKFASLTPPLILKGTVYVTQAILYLMITVFQPVIYPARPALRIILHTVLPVR
jgi:hypothetical protein